MAHHPDSDFMHPEADDLQAAWSTTPGPQQIQQLAPEDGTWFFSISRITQV